MTVTNNQPQIYYVVQGRAVQNKSTYIDKTFIDLDPTIARKRAFDFLDFHLASINEDGELVTVAEEKCIRSNYYLDELNKFSVQIKKKDTTSSGIGLYLVVRDFIQNTKEINQTEDKFLLYTDINPDKETIKEMIQCLFREFGLYKYLNIPTLENKLEMGYQFGEILDAPSENYFILRTPFDFKSASYKLFNDRTFNNKILYLLNKNNHLVSSFINELNWHRIRIHVSSFLNTRPGYIFLGNIRNTNAISTVFEGKSIADIRSILQVEILNYFPEHKDYISFEFVSINNAVVAIIQLKNNNLKTCFYGINTEDKFYYRRRMGIVSTVKISEIINHLRLSRTNESQIRNI